MSAALIVVNLVAGILYGVVCFAFGYILAVWQANWVRLKGQALRGIADELASTKCPPSPRLISQLHDIADALDPSPRKGGE